MDDVEAIRQLKARYFRLMDTKDWAGMREVFTDDVVMDMTGAGGRLITGGDEFMSGLQEILAGATSVHHRRRRVHERAPGDPRRRDDRPSRAHARDRAHVGLDRDRDLGAARHRDLA